MHGLIWLLGFACKMDLAPCRVYALHSPTALRRGLAHSSCNVWLLGLLALTGLTGCGETGPERIGMWGMVTYNGEPIEDGEISFQPVVGTKAPPTSTTITDGKYQLPAKWALVPGTYQVAILSYRVALEEKNLPGSTLDRPPMAGGIEVKDQLLPAKFNTKSTIEKVTVESGQAPIEQNFDLQDDDVAPQK